VQGVLHRPGLLIVWTLLLFAGGFTLFLGEPNFVTALDVQCIRNSMTLKQECPVCRKSANEGQIRPMIALEEAVDSWKAARCAVQVNYPYKQPTSFAGP
jgi:hypothetical protein